MGLNEHQIALRVRLARRDAYFRRTGAPREWGCALKQKPHYILHGEMYRDMVLWNMETLGVLRDNTRWMTTIGAYHHRAGT